MGCDGYRHAVPNLLATRHAAQFDYTARPAQARRVFAFARNPPMPGNPIGQFGAATIVTDGATQVFDCSSGGVFQWTLGASRTMSAPINQVPEQQLQIRVIQDGTGSRLVTWPGSFVWSGGTAPTLTTTASRMDIVYGDWDTVNSKWRMRASVLNYVV